MRWIRDTKARSEYSANIAYSEAKKNTQRRRWTRTWRTLKLETTSTTPSTHTIIKVFSRKEIMKIDSIHIKGFRNFIDCEVEFGKHTLIVGENDIGKSNLLHALRILFDPSFSSRDFELDESDFNITSECSEVVITAKIIDVSEDCLVSIFKEARSDDGTVYVRFQLKKGEEYIFLTGPETETLEETASRYYIQHLQMEYVASTRDLSNFLKRQQNRLLDIARVQRTDEEEQEDQTALTSIQEKFDELNNKINELHYVSDSLNVVNERMTALSALNAEQQIQLVAGNTDAGELVDNLKLAYLSGEAPLTFGGDGRRNQLYFATWLSKQELASSNQREKVVFFAVEEPEAHLHPQQQRRLSEYLSSNLDEQILMTTHSSQILARFTDGKIVRLAKDISHKNTKALSYSTKVDEALNKFGYRMNSITSEVFFSRGVLLVEGSSEVMFYTALSGALGINLDQLNLSVISVDGVGFKKYLDVCISLEIPVTIRTDNDIFRVYGNNGCMRYRYAGVERAVDLLEILLGDSISEDTRSTIEQYKHSLVWEGEFPTEQNSKAAECLKMLAEEHGIYLALKDLENDLSSGPLRDQLAGHYGRHEEKKIVEQMQKRKAERMYDFLKTEPDLTLLASNPISAPLRALAGRNINVAGTDR